MTFKRQWPRNLAIAAGYRSGLEESIAAEIKDQGLDVLFETDKLSYIVPHRNSTYTPDFRLPKKDGFWYLETKGRFTTSDRAKHLLIQGQKPDIDIRFLFQNSRAKIYKGSKTRLQDWCDKHGFLWCHKKLPQAWIDECLAANNQ